jgi:hypothetical protein
MSRFSENDVLEYLTDTFKQPLNNIANHFKVAKSVDDQHLQDILAKLQTEGKIRTVLSDFSFPMLLYAPTAEKNEPQPSALDFGWHQSNEKMTLVYGNSNRPTLTRTKAMTWICVIDACTLPDALSVASQRKVDNLGYMIFCNTRTNIKEHKLDREDVGVIQAGDPFGSSELSNAMMLKYLFSVADIIDSHTHLILATRNKTLGGILLSWFTFNKKALQFRLADNENRLQTMLDNVYLI